MICADSAVEQAAFFRRIETMPALSAKAWVAGQGKTLW
jgi:hypothetical protein